MISDEIIQDVLRLLKNAFDKLLLLCDKSFIQASNKLLGSFNILSNNQQRTIILFYLKGNIELIVPNCKAANLVRPFFLHPLNEIMSQSSTIYKILIISISINRLLIQIRSIFLLAIYKMIDQLRQASLSSFRGRLKHFQINFKVNPKSQSLLIFVQNTHNLENLSRTIDQRFIREQQVSFQGVFEQPHDICFHLINNFNDIVIEEDCLSFEYPYGIKKKSKRMLIKLFKQEVNQKEVIRLETQKIRKELAQLRRQKDQQIHYLEHKYKDVKETLEKYARRTEQLELKLLNPQVEPKDIQKLEDLIESLAQEIKGMKENPKFPGEKTEKEEFIKKISEADVKQKELHNAISELKMSLKGQEDKNKEVIQQLQKLRTSSQSKFLKEEIPKPEVKLPLHWLDHQSANPHKDYFKIAFKSNTLATITKIKSEWHNFVNKYAVLENQILKYYVKLMNVPKNFLMVGFCTQEGLGKCMAPESVYYDCYGSLMRNGIRSEINMKAFDGETIECIADMVNFKIQWAKEGKRIAEIPIPISMRDEPLYFSVLLFFEGDEVDIHI